MNSILVVIPCLNEERTLEICLASILKEFSKEEVVLVDNGSIDSSLEIARRFNIRILKKSNCTISALRNFGAEAGDSDLLCFIDADCEISGAYREAVNSRFQDKSIVATGSKYILPEKPHFIESAWFGEKIPKLGEVAYINSGNLIVRRAHYQAVEGFTESLETGEDYELCQKLKSQGQIFSDPEIKAIHHGNPKSWSGFYRKQFWHGKGGLGSLKHNKFDKPLMGSAAFFILLLGLVLGFLLSPVLFFVCILGLFGLLSASALFHCRDDFSFKRFFILVPIYALYYLARGLALVLP